MTNGKDCMTERAAKFVVEDALMALKDMQSVGLMHRDVQPKNFVIAAIQPFDTVSPSACVDQRL